MTVMAIFTFREALRKKALLGALVLTALFLALYGVGMHFALADIGGNPRMTAVFKTAVAAEMLLFGLYALSNIAALLAIFTAVGTIAGEIEQGTLHAIVPKPLHRWQIVVGKWLGYALMLAAYTAITALVAVGLVYAMAGYVPPHLWQGIGLMAMQTLLLLSLTILGTTFLPTIVNGIAVFMFYATANLGGMLERIGELVENQTLTLIGVITSLVIPSDALWRMAAHHLQPALNLALLGQVGGGFIFFTATPPNLWMLVYAVAYGLVAVAAGAWVFSRRDL